jgi:hypothetical protein
MRDRILSEIKRLAEANGGKPLGSQAFEKATGIRRGEWYAVHWARWGDALADAGLAPNTLQPKLDSDFVLRKVAVAYRHFGRPATYGELRLFCRQDADFPSHTTITNHYRSQANLAAAVKAWAEGQEGFEDVAAMIPIEALEPTPTPVRKGKAKDGGVYLLRSGDFYKIGQSGEVEKRIKQITVALPDKATLEHTITTDDPPGIEAYWHRRFRDRRANGEWFKLTAADILAFKRRRFQ